MVAVTPEKQKTFEEAKAEVTAAATRSSGAPRSPRSPASWWIASARARSIEAVAKETGAKVQKAAGVTRNTVPQGLTQGAVQQAFALPKGGAASALTADGKSRIILRVADIKPAPAGNPRAAGPPQGRGHPPDAG